MTIMKNFISIDFETANEKRFSPCAIGIVVAKSGEIIDEFYSLINPQMKFSSYNIDVHGINPWDVQDAPTFTEIWPTLHRYLANNLVVAHNASFDMSVLRQTLDYYSLSYPELDYLCTRNIAKRVWPNLMNYKLDTIARYFDITFEHHQALEDARVCSKVLSQAMQSYQTDSIDLLLEACGITKGKIYERGYIAPKSKRKTVRK